MSSVTLGALGEYLLGKISPICSSTYVGGLPTLQDTGIGIRLYGGKPSKNYLGSPTSLHYVTVQILFRSLLYPEAAGWNDAVFNLLRSYKGDNILGCRIQGPPMYMGITAEKLHEFQQTYQIIVEE